MISRILSNIFKIPDLRERVVFSLFILAVYRLGIYVTTPGVDKNIMADIMATKGSTTILGLFNMFSGGALEQLSIFALGIMPYISSSIIFSLLAVVIPQIGEMQKDGDHGQKKITQYTRYGTIVLCIVQSLGIAWFLQGLGPDGEGRAFRHLGPVPPQAPHREQIHVLIQGTGQKEGPGIAQDYGLLAPILHLHMGAHKGRAGIELPDQGHHQTRAGEGEPEFQRARGHGVQSVGSEMKGFRGRGLRPDQVVRMDVEPGRLLQVLDPQGFSGPTIIDAAFPGFLKTDLLAGIPDHPGAGGFVKQHLNVLAFPE